MGGQARVRGVHAVSLSSSVAIANFCFVQCACSLACALGGSAACVLACGWWVVARCCWAGVAATGWRVCVCCVANAVVVCLSAGGVLCWGRASCGFFACLGSLGVGADCRGRAGAMCAFVPVGQVCDGRMSVVRMRLTCLTEAKDRNAFAVKRLLCFGQLLAQIARGVIAP